MLSGQYVLSFILKNRIPKPRHMDFKDGQVILHRSVIWHFVLLLSSLISSTNGCSINGSYITRQLQILNHSSHAPNQLLFFQSHSPYIENNLASCDVLWKVFQDQHSISRRKKKCNFYFLLFLMVEIKIESSDMHTLVTPQTLVIYINLDTRRLSVWHWTQINLILSSALV